MSNATAPTSPFDTPAINDTTTPTTLDEVVLTTVLPESSGAAPNVMSNTSSGGGGDGRDHHRPSSLSTTSISSFDTTAGRIFLSLEEETSGKYIIQLSIILFIGFYTFFLSFFVSHLRTTLSSF